MDILRYSNANPKPNPDPDRGVIFLGGNFPDTQYDSFITLLLLDEYFDLSHFQI